MTPYILLSHFTVGCFLVGLILVSLCKNWCETYVCKKDIVVILEREHVFHKWIKKLCSYTTYFQRSRYHIPLLVTKQARLSAISFEIIIRH